MDSVKRIYYNPHDKLNLLVPFLVSQAEEGEEFKEMEIDGNLYFVSSNGRVLSLTHNYPMILKEIEKHGYLYVSISGKHERIHRLVAEAFLSNENDLPVVHHKDGNKKNNNVSNLQWVSHSDNTKEYHRMKRLKEKNNRR